MRLDVDVQNLGIAKAQGVVVEVFAIGAVGKLGPLVGRAVLANLAALDTATVAVTLDTGKFDSTTQALSVVLDRAERILERNDRNNSASLRIAVLPPILQVTNSLLNGGSRQLSSLTSVSFNFNRDLRTNVAVSGLVVTSLNTGEIIPTQLMAVEVNVMPRRVTWTFPGLPGASLVPGEYEVRLKARSVTDTAGNVLTRDEVIRFKVTPGDATADGRTNELDYLFVWRQIRKLENQRDRSADVNGDGKVDAADLEWVKRNFGSSGAERPAAPLVNP